MLQSSQNESVDTRYTPLLQYQPALEDKIVQKVVVDLRNAIYEQDFLDCSYGVSARTRATPSTG